MIEKFDRLHGLPDGFFDITTANIRSLFPNPTLVQLDGRDSQFLFISILLHGNEYTGLEVMQKILAEHAQDLPRSILLFVGNVRAAEANRRFLPDQVDYNKSLMACHSSPPSISTTIPAKIHTMPVSPIPICKTRTWRRDLTGLAWCSTTAVSAPWPSTGFARRLRWNAVCPATRRE
jgi:hypothetical protein